MERMAQYHEKDLVLVGGGHAHVGVLKMLAMRKKQNAWRPNRQTRVTLIAKETLTPYSGMLPGYVAGHYASEDCHIDLVPLARLAGATLIHAAATRVDPEAKTVHIARQVRGSESVEWSPPIAYDVLSINVGITPDTAAVPGAAEHTTTVKPIDRFVARFEQVLRGGEAKLRDSSIAIVGGGAGGTELCLALHHRLLSVEKIENVRFVLYTRGQVLSGQNAYGRRAVRETLRSRGIRLVEGARVLGVSRGSLRFENADGCTREEPFDHCLWCTNASPAPWLAESGLATDAKGFVLVDETLRSVSHPDVFAAGDCATVRDHPRPKAGVFAVRQGAPLMENLTSWLSSRDPGALRRHVPQSAYLSLLSTGDRYAIGLRGSWGFQGAWVWRLKDWIDTTWMAKYTSEVRDMLASMAGGEAGKGRADGRDLGRHGMFCAGCGSKVGPDILSSVLQLLRDSPYGHVAPPPEEADDAAVLEVGGACKAIAQSVDFFRSFVEDPFVFGAIAANHALSDIYAMGVSPRAALAVAVVPRGNADKVRDCLLHMLSGACITLAEADCELSGGHSAQGDEMALGFAVTGMVGGAVMKKANLMVGQKLILTKALGTGVLLAAEMRGMCRGEWMDGAIDSMRKLNRVGMEAALKHSATACTDVTGFGLAGHLREMVVASKVLVEIDLTLIPVLDGAMEMSNMGVESSLFEDNLKLSDAIQKDEGTSNKVFPLLFDPQTSGGLLFGVPSNKVESCLADLHSKGFGDATCIGTVTGKNFEKGGKQQKRPVRLVNKP